jgi:hypothetical protein
MNITKNIIEFTSSRFELILYKGILKRLGRISEK